MLAAKAESAKVKSLMPSSVSSPDVAAPLIPETSSWKDVMLAAKAESAKTAESLMPSSVASPDVAAPLTLETSSPKGKGAKEQSKSKIILNAAKSLNDNNMLGASYVAVWELLI